MMGIFGFLMICLVLWLCWKLGWAVLKIAYVLCIGLPLAIGVGIIGLVLCCTIIFIPVGTALIHAAGWLVCPF